MDTVSVMAALFVLGYLAILCEHRMGINKATSALLMAVAMWAWQFAYGVHAVRVEQLKEHLADVTQVVLLLLGSLTIVEIIQAHGGDVLLQRCLRLRSKRGLLWGIGIATFLLSSILDNLTSTIVMIMLLRRLLPDREERLMYGSVVVMAANAGGPWTPIGDVTTMMLWVGGQVSAMALIEQLVLPSIVCTLVVLLWFSCKVRGELAVAAEEVAIPRQARLVVGCGLCALLSVPVCNILTGMPPFMGVLLALSAMWVLTDVLHAGGDRHLRVQALLPRVDLSSILFFLGILLAVGALASAGALEEAAALLDRWFQGKELVAVVIGLLSAVIDNVPLVAACIGMYPLEVYPQDSPFWLLIAYCAGTGGNLLLLGSAAGVAFMGLEQVSIWWYVRVATLPAALGYFAGVGAYLLLFK